MYDWYAPWYRYPWAGGWLSWGTQFWGSTSTYLSTTTNHHLKYSSALNCGSVGAVYCCNTNSVPFGATMGSTSTLSADNCCLGAPGHLPDPGGSIGINGPDGDIGEQGQKGMPEPLAVGASKSVTEVTEQKTPTLLPQDLYEEPATVMDAVLVSWEFLTGLVEAANSIVSSGPMKGIPLS